MKMSHCWTKLYLGIMCLALLIRFHFFWLGLGWLGYFTLFTYVFIENSNKIALNVAFQNLNLTLNMTFLDKKKRSSAFVPQNSEKNL